ncbi:MAG: Fic family protein [Planctomycetes bacterium]|nr:Fic family protein [Planctomycetota bacterium]
MKRGMTGSYVSGPRIAGEQVRAFRPLPLPPNPQIEIDADLRERMDHTYVSLGRLDSASALLPDISLFLYTYIRREAVLSSKIEGTQSSLSDLLLFEIDEAPGVPVDDVREVSNYVSALDYGISKLKDGFPLSNRLLKEIHGILLSRGRGADKLPGEFRISQNWIGGTRPGNAAYVPPPAEDVPECISQLEKFIHNFPERTPALIKAALAHVQFETIHPFLDGNGRLGRLLITLILCSERVLSEPLLYLSIYLKKHRTVYYELLQEVRVDGDFEKWISFFIDGVRETAEQAVATARKLTVMFAHDRKVIEDLGRPGISALRVYTEFQKHPVLSLPLMQKRTGLSAPTVASAVKLLTSENLKIIKELTGKRRNRVFGYKQYLDTLGADE